MRKSKKKRDAGIKAPFPREVEPMLCTLLRQPFDEEGWIYEVKLDGYRIISYKQGKDVKLQSRGLLNFTRNYSRIAQELSALQHDLVLDGEMCVLNDEGKPDFDALQAYKGEGMLVYYVFDIIWCDGYDLTGLPLNERKAILKNTVEWNEVLRYSDDSFPSGIALFEQVRQLGLEGVVAKKKDSAYIQGKKNRRTRNWFKIPTSIIREFVIGGWTESTSRRSFRSLLFGGYENEQLICVGHAGGGFKEREMPTLLASLRKNEIERKPFSNEVKTDTTPHWVKPVLVGRFKFATWTKGGKIRKPATFLGLRNDKKPSEVFIEEPVERAAPDNSPPRAKKNPNARTSPEAAGESNWKVLDQQSVSSRETFDIGDCAIELTNVERELWKARNIRKADLITYYHSVSRYILPHLQQRPLSLHLKPYGPVAPGFYIKDMEGRQPDCAEIYTTARKHKKRGKRDVIEYLVCNNEATLLYVINLGCIDVNPWTSRVSAPYEPDYIVIDLDPSDEDFRKAIVTGQAAKDFFDSHGLKAYIKTSGKTGLHLLLPCSGFDFTQARAIAERICAGIHSLVPDITTTEISVSKRGKKLFLDANQNDEADTIASVYSVRPFKEPTVSTPLEWKELKEGLDPLSFTMANILQRIGRKGELWNKLGDRKIVAANGKRLRFFL